MARKLKVYQTSLGFYDLVVATPSMKAAAEAWGADRDIFQRGFARQTEDAEIVEAATKKPGVVLRRPVGSSGKFTEQARLPKAPVGRKKGTPATERDSFPDDKAKQTDKAEQAAALERQRQQKRQETEQRKKEAQEKRTAERREHARAKAAAELERSRKQHEQRLADITKRRKELDAEADDEDRRWEEARERYRTARDRAGS